MGNTQKRNLTNAVVIMMTSTIVSRLVGFLRELLTPNMLGADKIGDAYYIAFQFPDLMYNMLVGGAVAAALIPILAGYLEKNQEEAGWRAVGTFINVIFIAMIGVCILGVIFAPQLVQISAAGYKMKSAVLEDKQQTIELAVRLTRILFPSVAFLMLAGLTNGILNSYNRFAAAAYGPTIYNLSCALSIFFLSRISVESVAFGVMGSSMLYFLFQLTFAVKNLKHYKIKIFLNDPGFRKIVKLAIPSIISSSIVQVNLIISASFSTFFGEGNVVALNNANRTWNMPYGVFALGMGIAILPTLSAKLAVGEIDTFKKLLIKSLNTVLLPTIPCAVGFAVLSKPIIRTIFQFTHRFTEHSVDITSRFLLFFSIALITQSIVAIMNRGFYANNDTKTPLFIGASTIAINITLSYLLGKTTLGAAGMALSYSIASTINAITLLIVLNKKLNGIYLDKLLGFLKKVVPASIVMGVVVILLNSIPISFGMGNGVYLKLLQLVYISVLTLIGAIVYFGIVLLWRVDEAVTMMSKVLGKLKFLSGRLSKNIIK